jgi:opacity protein-like surface antigen
MKERNVVPSGMAGFLWKIPAVPFWVGPEVCVGRGNTTSSVSDVRLDPFGGGENRIYKTDFQRKLFYGALIRFAYQFYQEYLVYLSAGVDHSQFSIKRTLHHQATVPATSIQRTKNMNGTVFGLGVEKNFNQFIVGFDIKMIQYRKYNVVDDVRVAHGVDPAFLNFPVQPKIRMFSLRVAYRF